MKKILLSNFSLPQITKSKILLDTNVLLWIFYERITTSSGYQKDVYPRFVEHLLKEENSNLLYTTIYNILEAFSVIENNEYDIYLTENNIDKTSLSKKNYRQISTEREKVKQTITLFYEQVSNAIEILENQISKEDLIKFYDTYTDQYLDPNDFALIQICNQGNFNYLLTDDADFKSYPNECNFKLITGNSHVFG